MSASSRSFNAQVGRILALYSAASPGIVTAQLAVPTLTSELGVSGRLQDEKVVLVRTKLNNTRVMLRTSSSSQCKTAWHHMESIFTLREMKILKQTVLR